MLVAVFMSCGGKGGGGRESEIGCLVDLTIFICTSIELASQQPASCLQTMCLLLLLLLLLYTIDGTKATSCSIATLSRKEPRHHVMA